MTRSLRRLSLADAGSRRARRPARGRAIALTLLGALAFVSACETAEMAPPPPPPADEVFESPPPSAPIQEESLGPPPAPAPPPGTEGITPSATPSAPAPQATTPQAGYQGSTGERRKFPLSSPGAVPPGVAPIQPEPSE